MKIKVKALLHWKKRDYEDNPEYVLASFDMTSIGPHYALIGEQEFEVEVPDDYDPTPQIIAGLKTEKQRILAEAHVKAGNIDEQIQRLLCIEHKHD